MEINKKYTRTAKSAYIRETRLEEEMSGTFLAEVIGINKGYLSDIEHGKRSPSDELFKDLISLFDVVFFEDENILLELDDQIKKVYSQLIIYNMIEPEDINAIKEKEYIYKNSIGHVKYDLLNLLLLIEKKVPAEEMIALKNIIERNITLLTTEQREIFTVCKILINIYNKKYNDARQQILRIQTNNIYEINTSTFLKYLLVYCNFLCNEHIENIILCDKVASELSLVFRFNMMNDVLIIKGLTLWKMAKYNESGKLLVTLYENGFSDYKKLKVIKEYLIKILIVRGNYLQAIEELEKFRKEYSDNELIFYEMFCNFRNENFNFFSLIKDRCIKPKCEYYFYIACINWKNNKKKYLKYLAATLKRIENDCFKKELILNLLLEEKLIEVDKIYYQDMYIKLLKSNSDNK